MYVFRKLTNGPIQIIYRVDAHKSEDSSNTNQTFIVNSSQKNHISYSQMTDEQN